MLISLRFIALKDIFRRILLSTIFIAEKYFFIINFFFLSKFYLQKFNSVNL